MDKQPKTEKLANSKTRRVRNTRPKDFKDKRPTRKEGDELMNREFNDYKWYVEDLPLAQSAAKLNWGVPLGSDLLDRHQLGNVQAYNSGVNKIPGIMAINFAMMPGISKGPNSPINVAARNLFTAVRRTVTSALPFGAADLMSYVLAADSLFAYHAFMTRIYGTLGHYEAENRFVGRALIEASGVDYGDAITNAGKLRYFIEQYRKKVNEYIFVPKDFGFMQRHTFMCQAIYKDSPSRKSQMYVFRPTYFHKWQSFAVGSAGSHLSAYVFTGERYGNITVDQMITYGNDLLNEIASDSDVATMISMLRRTYAESGSLQLQSMPDDYSLAPVYSENVLGQIHNADLVTFPSIWYSSGFNTHAAQFDVSQVSSELSPGGYNDFYIVTPALHWSYANGQYMARNFGMLNTQYMDTYNPAEATFEEIIDNSRAKVAIKFTTADLDDEPEPFVEEGVSGVQMEDQDDGWEIAACGLDIWHNAAILQGRPDGELNNTYYVYNSNWLDYSGTVSSSPLQTPGRAAALALLSNFDWAPRVSVYVSRLESGGPKAEDEKDKDAVRETLYDFIYCGDVWDFNNPAVISKTQIAALHEVCLLGAFKVAIEGNAWK